MDFIGIISRRILGIFKKLRDEILLWKIILQYLLDWNEYQKYFFYKRDRLARLGSGANGFYGLIKYS
jgi:hypothetical protein